MKAVSCPVILTGLSSRVDGSLGLRFSTPELRPDEKTTFFELQNLNMKMLLQPVDSEPTELKDVKAEFETKTPGQRLRGVLFILWKQSGEPGNFDTYYREAVEKFILTVKDKLQPE